MDNTHKGILIVVDESVKCSPTPFCGLRLEARGHEMLTALRILLLVLCVTVEAAAAEQWLPLADRDLNVVAGSALDFSNLVEAGPAGKHGWAKIVADGHIGFERRSTPQRFLGASLVFSGLNGGLSDKAGSDRLVQELKRTGYNLVRLHFIDAYLMTGRYRDFDFDPEQFDRLHYLLAQLKKEGIYWIVDGLTSDNAAWGDVRPHRWVKKHHAKLDVLTDRQGFAQWATLVERLWGTTNPYTGSTPLQDPAMLGLILVNEGSLAFLATIEGNRYPSSLGPLFRDWLKSRYGNGAALKAAWGGELKAKESLDGVVEVPATVRGNGPRDVDFARFVAELERKSYQAMEAQVRKLGFKGLTTAFDNWGFFSADITRSAVQWVDMHSYTGTPSAHGQPGSKLPQSSVHDNAARYVRELSNARQWGKPFTVTEYGQTFWNRWRHESAALLPAVAAHQGWDAIIQFAETPIQFDYRPSPFVRRQAIYPYGVGADPILRGGERLAALLFLRGDVAPAKGRIRLRLDAEQVLTRSAGWEQVPESLSRLAFVSAVGLDFGQKATSSKSEISFEMTNGTSRLAGKLDTALARAGLGTDESRLGVLRDAGILDLSNRTRPNNGIFQSDTGQIVLDGEAKRIEVVTDKTVAVVLRNGSATVGPLAVNGASGSALFAISALDNRPIAKSKRLLLWVLTDAINSGMQFKDSERTTIETLGTFPPQMRAVSATLRIAMEGGGEMKAWPLTLSGARRQAIPLTRIDGAIELRMDTAALPGGPAIFFEIAAE